MAKSLDPRLQLVPAEAEPVRTIPLPHDMGAIEATAGDVTIRLPERVNPLKPSGGSDCSTFNSVLLGDVLATMPPVRGGGTDNAERMVAATAALAGFQPTNEIEGMLAAQATGLHYAAMECMRRAMIRDQPAEAASKLRKDAANLSRGMCDMLVELDRRRGKGSQIVRVERVTVNDGGQAIVGNVQGAAKPGR